MGEENYNVMTFEQFTNKYNSSRENDVPELQKMFLSLDRKMQLYHEHNYVILSFGVQDIVIYSMVDDNGEYQYDVDFKKTEQRSQSEDISQSVQKNIFYASCLAVGVYNDCLSYINPENPTFLKDNFNMFAENMPTEVVPYYRGVIERGASVYLSMFVEEKQKRDLSQMMQEMEAEKKAEEEAARMRAGSTTLNNKPKVDNWESSQAAFSSVALFPLIIAAMGIIIPIIIGILS